MWQSLQTQRQPGFLACSLHILLGCHLATKKKTCPDICYFDQLSLPGPDDFWFRCRFRYPIRAWSPSAAVHAIYNSALGLLSCVAPLIWRNATGDKDTKADVSPWCITTSWSLLWQLDRADLPCNINGRSNSRINVQRPTTYSLLMSRRYLYNARF